MIRGAMSKTSLAAALAVALASAAGGSAAQPAPVPLPLPDTAALLAAPPKPATVKGDFTVVTLGDWMSSQPVSSSADPEFRKVADIVKAADVAVTNQEMMFLDPMTFGGYAPPLPANMLGDPGLAKDEKALGVEMVGLANNHAIDWGIEGLRAVAKALDAAGVVHAGYGETRKAAQAASFFDTPNGRVALIATATTFKPSSGAQDAVDGFPSRPGASILRRREIEIVTPEAMAHVRALAGHPESRGDVTLDWGENGKTYREGPEAGFIYEINAYDRYGVLQAIRDGKAKADLAILTVHAHESTDGTVDHAMSAPARFLVDAFHEAVDAGADVVMASGPHALRGIEIYRGKPIFYGLGVFIFRANVIANQEARTEQYVPALPRPAAPTVRTGGYGPTGARGVVGQDDWNDGLVATTTFRDGKLKEVRLYPLDHQRAAPANARSPTRLADGDHARYILTQLQKFSAPFGTKISIEGSVGVIRP
jgi:Bacterial capsule synthesis protein PGA_cap